MINIKDMLQNTVAIKVQTLHIAALGCESRVSANYEI